MGKVKLLVVDDSPTHLKLASEPFMGDAFEVATAMDGEEALAKVRSERPAVIILDVVIPKINGFQVCRQIKRSPDLCDIKVVMLSSKNQESDIFWGRKQGADAYVTKPFTDAQLLDAVNGVL
jgi:twitching motility two-component system response regulator PilH